MRRGKCWFSVTTAQRLESAILSAWPRAPKKQSKDVACRVPKLDGWCLHTLILWLQFKKEKKNASQIVFKLQPLDQVCRSVQSACLVLREALGANSGIKKERHRVKGS